MNQDMIDIKVFQQVQQDYRMPSIAKDLGLSFSQVIKSMKRTRYMMPVSCFCASTTGCKTTCRKKDGIFLTGGLWYCYTCYRQWPSINHAEVKHYTRAGVEGSEKKCKDALEKIHAQIRESFTEHDEQAFYNKMLGEPFVDDCPVCCLCSDIWTKGEREGATTKAGNWICHKCIHSRSVDNMTRRERQMAFEAMSRSKGKRRGSAYCAHCGSGMRLIKLKTGEYKCSKCFAETVMTVKPRGSFPMYTEVSQGIHVKHDSRMLRSVRMTPKEMADLKDRVAEDAAQYFYNSCGEITLEPGGKKVVPVSYVHDEITLNNIHSKGNPIRGTVTGRMSGDDPLNSEELDKLFKFHGLEGWDVIQYGKFRAFLRFDGVIVRQSQGGWVIETDNPLTNESYWLNSYLEALSAADQHIPMGELL